MNINFEHNHLIKGDCIRVMQSYLLSASIDLIVTDPPYLVNYRDRFGCTIVNDDDDSWVAPAFTEIARVLKPGRFCVCFYAWNRIDRFLPVWKSCGLFPVGCFVFVKRYASGGKYVRFRHEAAYLLAK